METEQIKKKIEGTEGVGSKGKEETKRTRNGE